MSPSHLTFFDWVGAVPSSSVLYGRGSGASHPLPGVNPPPQGARRDCRPSAPFSFLSSVLEWSFFFFLCSPRLKRLTRRFPFVWSDVFSSLRPQHHWNGRMSAFPHNTTPNPRLYNPPPLLFRQYLCEPWHAVFEDTLDRADRFLFVTRPATKLLTHRLSLFPPPSLIHASGRATTVPQGLNSIGSCCLSASRRIFLCACSPRPLRVPFFCRPWPLPIRSSCTLASSQPTTATELQAFFPPFPTP